MTRAKRPTISFLDRNNISAIKSVDEAVFIAYLPSANDPLYSAFTGLAQRYNDKFTFAITTDSSLATNEGLQFPSVVCYKSLEGEQVVLPEGTGLHTLQNFIEIATAPVVGEFTRRNEMNYMKVLLFQTGTETTPSQSTDILSFF